MTIRRRFYVYPDYSTVWPVSPQVLYNQCCRLLDQFTLSTFRSLTSWFFSLFQSLDLREHPAHVATEPLVIEQTLDAAYSRNSDVLIPDPPLCEADDVVGGNSIDSSLDLTGAHPSASGHDLSADILSKGGGSVQGQQDGGLQLRLGALDLGFGDGLGEASPLAHGEVHEVVDASKLVGHEVNAPETITGLAYFQGNIQQ